MVPEPNQWNFFPLQNEYTAEDVVPTDQISEPDLMTRIAQGDADALVALFRRRRDEVYRFAVHMTGAPATAEDIVQEVFLTVIRQAARFDPARGSVIGWLLGVARNLARQRVQRERNLAPLSELPAALSHSLARNDPFQRVVRDERVEGLRQAVRSLPPRYREVVLLCDLQELSYEEAAGALDCAVGTVRSRLHRGRRLLAIKLRGEVPQYQGFRFRRGSFA